MENSQVGGREKVLLWRRRIEQWERSGLAQTEFCRRGGIAISTFTCWKRRLKSKSPNRPAFIPVQLKEEAPARTMPNCAWACEIVGPQVKLRLRERPDTACLRKLVAVIAGEA